MSAVQTVLGPVDAQELGITLAHEHLIFQLTEAQTLDDVNEMVAELRPFVDAGGRAILEMSNTGMGRDVTKLRDIALQTGLHIVAATGLYWDKFYPGWVRHESIDQVAARFVHEVQVGIGDTGIRAGLIGEIGTSARMTRDEEKVLRAAARAQLRTGAGLFTHTEGGYPALEQLEVLLAEGVPADRIVIGHQDLHSLPEVHRAIAQRGAYVAFDTFGKQQFLPDRERCERVVQLINHGCAERILLSLDISRKAYLSGRGGFGFAYSLTHIVPMLSEMGVTESQMDLMLRQNPARVLAFA